MRAFLNDKRYTIHMAEDKQFFVGQKAFIEKNGELLILNDPFFGLDLPGGKIQEGETDFNESLRREVREETGLEIEIGEPFHTWYFELPKTHKYPRKHVFLVGYRCKYIHGKVTISDEHDKFQWVNKESYKNLPQTGHTEALRKYFK